MASASLKKAPADPVAHLEDLIQKKKKEMIKVQREYEALCDELKRIRPPPAAEAAAAPVAAVDPRITNEEYYLKERERARQRKQLADAKAAREAADKAYRESVLYDVSPGNFRRLGQPAASPERK